MMIAWLFISLFGFSQVGPASPPPEAVSLPGGNLEVPNAGSLMAPDGTINEEGVLFQPTDGYVYDPTNRRDPFKPFGQSQASQAPTERTDDPTAPGATEPAVPTEPLRMYDVSQFRLMGIIWRVQVPKAVVKDPVGKQHLIYKNTKIGRNNGFVAAIREGEVIIVEPTVGDNGMPSAITRSLTLKK